MTAASIGLIIAGATVGAGIWILLVVLVPERADMAAALAPRRIVSLQPLQVEDTLPAKGFRGWQAMLERRAANLQLVTPDPDLRILEIPRGRFLLLRITWVLGALLVGQFYTWIFWAFEFGISPAIPEIVFLALAAAAWYLVGQRIKDRAAIRRRQMRYALVSYLTLVALHRAAGQAMGAALANAAGASSAWTYRRIQDRISRSSRAGESPWQGIADLATELGIDELSDLAAIADTAGTQGAAVYMTLMARASSLRRELQKTEESAAAQASTLLALPRVMLIFTMTLFLLYPAITGLLIQ